MMTHEGYRLRRVVLATMHTLVVLLSAALIVALSIVTFRGGEILHDRSYMQFQLWVCLAFILDFAVELVYTPSGQRMRYARRHWYFLLLSIPYLNIIDIFGLTLSADALYYIRFVPMFRCALALSIVLGFISSNRITSMLTSYIAILLMVTYFAGLIFYEREHPVNELVVNYMDAFWWSMMQATTLGCDIYPVTPVGKVLGVVLSFMGIIMFPLFTVYLANVITTRYKQRKDAAAAVSK